MEEQQTSQVETATLPSEDLEEAAMQAAIAESRGHEPPASTQEPQVAEVAQAEPEQVPAQVAEEKPEPPPGMFGMTEDQIKSALVKAGEVDDLKAQLRTIHGRYGELNSRIQGLQKAEQHGAVSAEAVGKVENIARQYHEAILDGDMEKADKLFIQTLQSMPRNALGDTQGNQDERLTEALTTQAKQLTATFEEKMLRMRHPDLSAVFKSNDFGLWRQTLPEPERQALDNSWDSLYVASKLDDFKAWQKSAAQSTQQTNQRQQRLANAVTPQGSAPAAPQPVSEEDAMQAAIRARIRPRMAAT